MSKLVQKWKKVDLEKTEIEVKNVSSLEVLANEKEIAIALDYEDDDYSLGLIYGMAFSTRKDVYYIKLDDLKKDKIALGLLANKDIYTYYINDDIAEVDQDDYKPKYKDTLISKEEQQLDFCDIYLDCIVMTDT